MADRPLIVPVAQLHVNWDGFIKAIHEHTSRSPVRLLDQMSMPIGDLSSFMIALAAFSENINAINALTNRPVLMEHLFFSFLITATNNEYIEILREGYVHCLDNIDAKDDQLIILMSGTVREWHDTCKVFCTTDYPFRVRYIFDCVFLYLEKLKIFSSPKKFLTDETFTIT